MALASNALLPLAYWYGHAETKKNPLLMDRLIRNLGDHIHDRFELDTQGIDTPCISLLTDNAS
jgi:polyribonucleotide 5'-hydroxyl-kinase